MRRFVIRAMTGLSLFFFLGCLAADWVFAKVLENSSIHGWKISAISDDRTGAFKHCGAASPIYNHESVDGIILAFFVDGAFALGMGFASPVWQLQPGSRYPISYQIDDSPVYAAEALALTSSTVSFSLAHNPAVFDLIRKGWLLKVRAAGGEFQLSLQNSSKVLAALLDCAQRYAQTPSPRGTSNPFIARDSVLTKRPANTAQLQAEATTITANILASSGLAGFRLAGPNSHESGILHAIWWANGVDGSTTIFDTLTVDVVIANLAAGESEDCKGNFASMKIASNEMAGARLKTVCELPDEMPRIRYANVLKRKKGGVYVFWMSESVDASEQGGDASVLENVSARLFDAAIQLGE